jgi:hypothetical protein
LPSLQGRRRDILALELLRLLDKARVTREVGLAAGEGRAPALRRRGAREAQARRPTRQ